MGAPTKRYQSIVGTEPRIQLNDKFANISDVGPFAIEEREAINEAERNAMTVSIKADKEVKMGIITDIARIEKGTSLKNQLFFYSHNQCGGHL